MALPSIEGMEDEGPVLPAIERGDLVMVMKSPADAARVRANPELVCPGIAQRVVVIGHNGFGNQVLITEHRTHPVSRARAVLVRRGGDDV